MLFQGNSIFDFVQMKATDPTVPGKATAKDAPIYKC